MLANAVVMYITVSNYFFHFNVFLIRNISIYYLWIYLKFTIDVLEFCLFESSLIYKYVTIKLWISFTI